MKSIKELLNNKDETNIVIGANNAMIGGKIGFFVPIFRGEILIGVLHLIFSLVTFGLFQLVIPFLYNKQFTSRMLTSGWELSDKEENMQIARLK